MDVILHYDSGHPTRLVKHNRLAALIERDGEPRIVDGWRLVWSLVCGRFAAAWDYKLTNPWPNDNRQLVRVSIKPKQ